MQGSKINLLQMKPGDLIGLLNSTEFGEVINERTFRRHKNSAGMVGSRVDICRYAAWLTQTYNEYQKQTEEQKAAKAAQRRAEITESRQDIGEIPPVVNPDRRARAAYNFKYFCEVYFPEVFYFEWSPDHLKVIEKIQQSVLKGGLFALAMPRGSGKALSLDTPLATPDGWTTMGNVKVGDRLFDENGKICNVTYVTEIMHGHPCYRVKFSDGEQIVCDAEHLWTVEDRYSRKNPLTLTTEYMAGRVDLPEIRERSAKRYRIALARPLQIPPVNLPIAPYSLGVWLGDGHSYSSRVTLAQWDYPQINDQVRWSGEFFDIRSVDQEANTITGVMTRTHKRMTSFHSRLRKLGLLQNKHIPAIYLRAGYSQRLALLNGLLDTDGHADKKGKCEIAIKYPKLADDFGELLSSLSIKYGRGEKFVELNGKKLGPYYRFTFTVHNDMQAFRLTRKQSRLKPHPKTRALSKSRHIVAIEPTDSVPVRCIQVDSSSHLYLAGKKIVPTHNTVLMQIACVWSAINGLTPFVCLIAASADRAKDLLGNMKIWLETNELLFADYPEVCFPVRKLERITNRQKGQRHNGRPTRIEWNADKIVLPNIEASVSSGVVISCSGLKGSDIRGQNHARPDGKVVRPQLVMIDDPQTTESAWSPSQSKRREAILAGDVLGMAGPGKKISGLMACTVIRPDDMADNILDREKHPDWQGQRTKMVYQFPKNEKLWEEYSQLRADSLRNDGDGSIATQFYIDNRKAMDEGSVVSWEHRFNEDEVSAIQHAMNLKLRDEAAFYAEYQNEPIVESEGEDMLTADQIAEKLNNHKRCSVPLGCSFLTMFIDVQQKALFWVICGWEDDFTGYVIDYGTWPEQNRPHFTLRDIRKTLAKAKPGAGLEGIIYNGLEKLCAEKLGRFYRRSDSVEMRVDRCLIDANWGQSTDVVYQFCRQSEYAGILLPSHGRYTGASSIPFSEYKRKKGDRVGLHWRIPNTAGKRAVRHALIDTNYWKSFIHARLAVAMGDPGCLSLFGKSSNVHQILAEHLTAEYRVKTEARGRVVDEWKVKANRPDNHWFDCIVGAAVAASIQGAKLFGIDEGHKKAKKIKLSEIQKRRR